MTDRTELFEAALDNLPEGIALIGVKGQVVFWNRAAESFTGHTSVELLGRQLPGALEPLLLAGARLAAPDTIAGPHSERATAIRLQNSLGHELEAIVRTLALRDGMGQRIGSVAIFRPAEAMDALPHGECGEGVPMEASQAEVKNRLKAAFEEFNRGGQLFGVLWITVDQASDMRKTHGARACEAMLESVERTMINGLRPQENLGRWGDDEFLLLSHERNAEVLAAHAQVLAGLARTADFRWWGDRPTLSISVGSALAEPGETLGQLLERAKAAMSSSIDAGGNQVTPALGRQPCSPS